MEKFDNLTFLEILKKHDLHNEPRYRMKEIYELMKIAWNEAVNESNSARSDSCQEAEPQAGAVAEEYPLTEEEEIEATLRFIDLVGIKQTAKFIVNQNQSIKGLQKNNDRFVKALRKSLE